MRKLTSIFTVLLILLFASQVYAGPLIFNNLASPGAIGSVTPATGTFTSLVATTADINAGTVDATIGATTPAAGTFTAVTTDTINESTPAAGVTIDSVLLKDGGISPLKAKGPAIITTFAGTVTATASTTVTFSSAADAILAGYSATNPILGTTLISNALTRYIVSWTNATTCEVDSAVTWAGTAITSTQLPIATFVNSAGVTKGWMNAAGNIYTVGNTGIGTAAPTQIIDIDTKGATGAILLQSSTDSRKLYMRLAGGSREVAQLGGDGDSFTSLSLGTSAVSGYTGLNLDASDNMGLGTITFGTSAVKVFGMLVGTAPTTSPADAAQMWVADRGAVAGDAALHMRDEVGTNGPVAFAVQRVITQAATDTLTLNEVMGTVLSNYGQAAENTQTLPAAAAGYKGRVSISTTGAGAFHLKAGASDKIYLNGTALDDGDKVTLAAPAVGDYFDFWTIQTGASAYDWVVVSGVGILIDGGV